LSASWEQAITQAATAAGIKSYDPVAWACNRLAGSAGPILRYLLFRWNLIPTQTWKASKSKLAEETGINITKGMVKRLKQIGVNVKPTTICNVNSPSLALVAGLNDLMCGHFVAPVGLNRLIGQDEIAHRNLISIDRSSSRFSTDQNLSLETKLIQLGVNAQRAKVFVMSIPPNEITAIIARAGQQTGVERIGGYLYASLNNALRQQQRKTA
jgi:hypothetical protein